MQKQSGREPVILTPHVADNDGSRRPESVSPFLAKWWASFAVAVKRCQSKIEVAPHALRCLDCASASKSRGLHSAVTDLWQLIEEPDFGAPERRVRVPEGVALPRATQFPGGWGLEERPLEVEGFRSVSLAEPAESNSAGLAAGRFWLGLAGDY